MPGASLSSTARVASGVTSRAVRPVPPVVRTRSATSRVGPGGERGGDPDGLVGHQGALGEGVAVLGGPRGDGVARGVGPLAAVARVGDGEDGKAHGRYFLTLPFVQNGSFTTSAGSRSPRHSTSNFVPGLAAAAGRYVVPMPTPSDGLSVPLRTMSTSRPSWCTG